ncbi:GIY-YIG nuclease family protein [Salmonella enterica subsp. enterica serovar Saintpaul]|nr:GIY-YIG nuclease family protein [Salmonella enterica subsp. enterica serovar Saintpaul]
MRKPTTKKSQAFTKEQAQAKIDSHGKGITLVGDYVNNRTETQFRCSQGHDFNAPPERPLKGKGCPVCNNPKLTAEEVQKRLEGRGITLIGEYTRIDHKTLFRCDCGYEWMTRAHGLLRGIGCPRCHGNAPITDEFIREKLIELGNHIELIGKSSGSETPVKFRCHHGHEFERKPTLILRKNGGGKCPICFIEQPRSFALSPEIVQNRLHEQGKGLKVVKFADTMTLSDFSCPEGHNFKLRLHDLLRLGDCPVCTGHIDLTEDMIKERLVEDGRGIKLVGSYLGARVKNVFECLKGHQWEAQVHQIFRGSGCPHCAEYGVYGKTNVYVYVMHYKESNLVKIGISNDPERRHANLQRSIGSPVQIYRVFAFGEGKGLEIKKIEDKAKAYFADRHMGLTGFDGATEIFDIRPEEAAHFLESLGGEEAWIMDNSWNH